MATDFHVEGKIALEQTKLEIDKARRVYLIGFVSLIGAIIVLTVIGTILNQTVPTLNFIIVAAFVAVLAYFVIHPVGLLTVFGLGTLEGLPKDWSINNIFTEGAPPFPNLSLENMAISGFALVKKYVHYASHIAYFAIVFFTVLGTWKLADAWVVLPILVVLAGMGLWAALSKAKPRWYFGITALVLMAALATFLYRGVGGATVVSDLRYSKAFDIEVENLNDTSFCGVRPGTRKFHAPQAVIVFIGDEKHVITSSLRVNKTPPEKSFVVDEKGCVVVSFAVNQKFKEDKANSFSNQIIALTFE